MITCACNAAIVQSDGFRVLGTLLNPYPMHPLAELPLLPNRAASLLSRSGPRPSESATRQHVPSVLLLLGNRSGLKQAAQLGPVMNEAMGISPPLPFCSAPHDSGDPPLHWFPAHGNRIRSFLRGSASWLSCHAVVFPPNNPGGQTSLPRQSP